MPSRELKTALLALQRANKALANQGQDVDLKPLYSALEGKADAEQITGIAQKIEQLAAALSEKSDAGHGHNQYALTETVEGIATALNGFAAKDHKHAYVEPETLNKALIDAVAGLHEALEDKAAGNHGHEDLEQAIAGQGEALKQSELDTALIIELLAGEVSHKAAEKHEHDEYATNDEVVELVATRAARQHKHSDIERLIKSLEQAIDTHEGEDHLTRDQIRGLIKQHMPAPLKVEPGKQGDEGPMGPMPRHEIKKNAASVWFRFEIAPDEWGEWIKIPINRGGGGGLSRADVVALIDEADSAAGVTEARVLELIEEQAVFDDYAEAEYLEEQPGDGSVKTFTFAADVQIVEIEMISTLADNESNQDTINALEGRAIFGAQEPTATLGAVLKHEQPKVLFGVGDTVKVLAPANTRINVHGARREASA